ncbi:MAG: hypothetical protein LR001_06130 [Clostridiales bacterium]|nr:hypothetical protein [Clostridiales bacterium]
MTGLQILGLVAILYGAFVIFISVKKPKIIWEMQKIQAFVKMLGEKGTVIFFSVWAIIAIAVGVWLIVR